MSIINGEGHGLTLTKDLVDQANKISYVAKMSIDPEEDLDTYFR